MTEIMTMATEFFFAHSVIICVALGVLLVLSSAIFLTVLNKRKQKTVEAKDKDKPELDALEKLYLGND